MPNGSIILTVLSYFFQLKFVSHVFILFFVFALFLRLIRR